MHTLPHVEFLISNSGKRARIAEIIFS